MSTDKLELLEVFVCIAEKRSFSQAAKELNVEPSTISRKIKKLEAHLKQSLITRDSREFTLTDEGLRFLTEATDLLNSWYRIEDRYQGAEHCMSGALKIIAPVGMGQHFLTASVTSFQKRFPDIRLTWILQDEVVKFSETGCDLWIRLGDHDDPSLESRRLAITQQTLVSSPEFLEGKSIRCPACLEKLNFISLDLIDQGQLNLTSARSMKAKVIYPEIVLTTNNFFAVHTAIMNSLGFGVLPWWFVYEDVKAGRLVEILPEYQVASLPINAVFLSGRYQSHRVGAFIEHLSSTFKNTLHVRALMHESVVDFRRTNE